LGDDTPAIPNFAVRILKPSASEDGEEEIVDTLYSSPYRPSQPIESGEYLFEARVGQAQASMLGALPSREPIKIVLNAGRIRPKAVVTDSDDDLSGVVWTFTSASDPTAKTTEYGADKEVILPAGKWIIEARLGSATATKELDLTAGEEVTPELRLEAGVLMPRVLYAKDCEDLPESGIQIEILEAKANSMGERKSVTTEYGNTTQVKLAAGKYLIKFALGHAKGEQEVEIKSGETVKVDLVADAGVMAVSVKAPYESYEVFHARKSLDGNRRSVVRQYHAQDTETVAAGKYVVVAYGPEDQKKEVEVEVAPCSREEVEIK
jgi:Ca-activated chloride channel family protein